MNVYDDFFRSISPDDWEFFSIDFLSSLGYNIIQPPSRGADGGRDSIVSLNETTFVVSCKHFIQSGKAVGVSDETSIIDRIIQHKAHGFIGVYSTLISTSLSDRFRLLSEQGYKCLYFDKNQISNILPKMSSWTLQKYATPKLFKYPLNVPEYMYRPLPCPGCGDDILSEKVIPYAMALIYLNNNDQLEYLYGCKKCISGISDRGWIECSQALHQEQLTGWINYVRDIMDSFSLSKDFYKNKNEFESALQQRIFPSNWGQWLGI